jgi:catechol 2,3-dioxygenase-like lactoylglutathione lyase family enzyme
MRLNAIGVTSSNFERSVKFYSILGLKFPDFKDTDVHVESIHEKTDTKLMIDKKELIKEILGKDPVPANHSSFAIEYDTPQEVNAIADELAKQGFTVVKAPWDAFWGQRYAVVSDPDGYLVDLYAQIS